MNMLIRKSGIALGALVLALVAFAVPAGSSAVAATGTSAAMVSAATPGGFQVQALFQKHVKSTTQSVTVFSSPTGSGSYGSWGPCTNFWTDRTDGIRYHTWVSIGGTTVDAWVTSDSTWVASGWC
jgi:hypothetical protein